MSFLNTKLNPWVSLSLAAIALLVTGGLDCATGGQYGTRCLYALPVVILAATSRVKLRELSTGFFLTFVVSVLAGIFRQGASNAVPYAESALMTAAAAGASLLVYRMRREHEKTLRTLADLEKTNTRLVEISLEKDRIIGVAAHDLRNPVSGIYSLSKTLLNDYEFAEEVMEMLNIFLKSSYNMLQLIEKLLNVSKIESGYLQLNYERMDFVSFARSHLELHKHQARNKNIVLAFEKPIGEVPVDMDSRYMGEVLDNLISNAIKYSHSDTRVTLRLTLRDHTHLHAEVIDQGQGIPLEEQGKLFQYFQRTSVQPTGGEASTGLGLAIARKIVLSHKGEIGVVSAPGQGSNFHFTLPLRTA